MASGKVCKLKKKNVLAICATECVATVAMFDRHLLSLVPISFTLGSDITEKLRNE